MSGSFLGGAAGAAIGFFVGGPAGARIGWNIGVIVGGLLFQPDGPEQKGPRLSDLKVQDSSYGRPIPIVWGTYRLSGNIIWLSPVVERRHRRREGGKGGGGTRVTTYTYYANFAIGLCEGEIQGVRRIWANGKLIYDKRASQLDATRAAISQNLNGGGRMTVYRGTEDQTPDPTIEAYEGKGNVPAHRGLAYIVFRELALEDYGNHLPQLSIEVVRGESVYRQGSFAAWEVPHDLSTLYYGHYFDETGGPMLARGWAWSYEGMVSGQATPYGAETTSTNHLVETVPGFQSRGYSDEPGFLATIPGSVTQAWFPLPGGTSFFDTGIPQRGAANMQSSFVRERGVTWYTSYYGNGNYPIYRHGPGGATVSQDSDAPRTILGVSGSYLYVLQSSNEIRRYDKETLEFVEVAYSGFVGSADTGYVQDDRFIYTAAGGAGIYEIDLALGTQRRIMGGTEGDGVTAVNTVYSFRKVGDGTFVYATRAFGVYWVVLIWEAFPEGDARLSDIVAEVCERVGLKPSQYNVTGITERVTGYALTQQAPARNALSSLLQMHFVDVADGGGSLRFVKRGGPVAMQVDPDDLVGSEAEQPDDSIPIVQVRTQDLELPSELSVSYLSAEQDHNTNTQSAYWYNTSSRHKMQLQVAAVFNDGDARGRVETLLSAAVINRSKFTFRTSRDYIALEPSDQVVLEDPDDGETWVVRIVKKSLGADGVINWEGLLDDPSVYPDGTQPPATGGTSEYPEQKLPYIGPSILRVVDGPPLRDQDTAPGLYLAAAGFDESWQGAAVEISRDAGQTWLAAAAIFEEAVIGTATDALGDFRGGNIPDELNVLTVKLIRGELESTDNSGLFGAVNAAYIGDELLLFRDAELIADRTYRLSGFLRGRRGTDWAVAGHLSGEQFILLEQETLYQMNIDPADVGGDLHFHTTSIGSVKGSTTEWDITNACVQSPAPVHFHAMHGSPDAADDILLKWTRSARVNYRWMNGTDVPLDTASEVYTLEILAGETVQRTVSVTGETEFTYAAQQITEDGFSAGQTIAFRLSQNGDYGVQGRTTTTSITR